MRYLSFDASDAGDGVTCFEALASTRSTDHAAVMAEVEAVLQWARHHFPHTHGPVEDGHDWDHALQVRTEDGHWHAVALTLTASPVFAEAFTAEFARSPGE